MTKNLILIGFFLFMSLALCAEEFPKKELCLMGCKMLKKDWERQLCELACSQIKADRISFIEQAHGGHSNSDRIAILEQAHGGHSNSDSELKSAKFVEYKSCVEKCPKEKEASCKRSCGKQFLMPKKLKNKSMKKAKKIFGNKKCEYCQKICKMIKDEKKREMCQSVCKGFCSVKISKKPLKLKAEKKFPAKELCLKACKILNKPWKQQICEMACNKLQSDSEFDLKTLKNIIPQIKRKGIELIKSTIGVQLPLSDAQAEFKLKKAFKQFLPILKQAGKMYIMASDAESNDIFDFIKKVWDSIPQKRETCYNACFSFKKDWEKEMCQIACKQVN